MSFNPVDFQEIVNGLNGFSKKFSPTLARISKHLDDSREQKSQMP